MTSRNLDSFAPAFNRAVSAYKAGNLAEAEQLCQQIVSARSDHFDALHVLAIVQAALGKSPPALANYDRALALRPDHADALSNRGNTLLALNRCEEALASYDRALAVRPDFAEALSNRGHALERADRLDEALASYDRALALQPRHVMAHCNAAALRLLRGDFPRGWPDYEWRWMKESVVLANRMFPQPLWRGEAIADKTILLHGRTGTGRYDSILPLCAAGHRARRARDPRSAETAAGAHEPAWCCASHC
jgi:tetratricopeptide (TPR) repeat protein